MAPHILPGHGSARQLHDKRGSPFEFLVLPPRRGSVPPQFAKREADGSRIAALKPAVFAPSKFRHKRHRLVVVDGDARFDIEYEIANGSSLGLGPGAWAGKIGIPAVPKRLPAVLEVPVQIHPLPF